MSRPASPARPHPIERVVLFGPESTGKTTLCRELAGHYATAWAREYLRDYVDERGAVPGLEDLPDIVAGQLAAEDIMAGQANRVLFCDTDPLQTAMYSQLYFGQVPAWLWQTVTARAHGLYLLTDVDVPWVPDPQRDMPHRRREIFARCQRLLVETGRRHAIVRGTWDQRFATACAAVDAWLADARLDAPGTARTTR